MAFDTVANIVSDAAVRAGLSAVSDVFGSTDANVVQLRGLLTDLGQEFAKTRLWTHLRREYTFSTVTGTEAYALPSDFRAMVDQTGWDRTNRLPLAGPASPQEWQYLQGTTVNATIRIVFRPMQGQLHLFPGSALPNAHTVAFEYATTSWVQPSGQSSPNTDTPTANTDTICFDRLLMVRALRWAFLRDKGFDSAAAEDDFRRAWGLAVSDDTPAPVLNLSRRQATGTSYFSSTRLVPDTGFGS